MIIEIRSSTLRVQIRDSGAEICSVKNENEMEFIWQADKQIWPRHAPVLFPIVGRLKDNQYSVNNKTYSLSQHGFARDMVFESEKPSASECVFTLRPSEATLNKYPFQFALILSYSVAGNSVACNYRVINEGAGEMYFSVGAHPGFNCPLLPEEKFEDYYLEFEKENLRIRPLENGLRGQTSKDLPMQNNTVPLTPGLFDNDALIFEQGQIHKVALRSRKSRHFVECECHDWPYFGIWTKKGCDRFLCLEPWWGITDSADANGNLQEKEGIIALPPAGEFSCGYTLRFG